jgi:acetylornithine/N-succinyldiaminopimelate aminotransferase
MSHLMNNYAPLPFAPVKGEGAWLYDADGSACLDLVSGVGVNALGHGHPDFRAAMKDQIDRLVHCSNLYHIQQQQQLSDRLAALSGADRMFFCNSGAEANEAAIKLARKYAHDRGNHRPVILVTEGSFHGRTLATVTATANPAAQAGFGPLPEGFVRVPFNDVAAMERAALECDQIAAVLIEPVQGEGGVNVPDVDYLQQVRRLCDARGWLMMLDEVQTGMGRTGRWFACQHSGIRPDVMALAKGLGAGMPIGACLAWGAAADTLTPGSHGSTFGGNPLACRAALATLDVIERDNLLDRSARLGAGMLARFRAGLDGLDGVKAVRGMGLMLGVELDRPCAALVGQALAQGLLINVTAGQVIRLLPPLVIDEADAMAAVDRLCGLIKAFLNVRTGAVQPG